MCIYYTGRAYVVFFRSFISVPKSNVIIHWSCILIDIKNHFNLNTLVSPDSYRFDNGTANVHIFSVLNLFACFLSISG